MTDAGENQDRTEREVPRPPAPPAGCWYCGQRAGSKAWMAVPHADDCRRPREGEQVITHTLLCFDATCEWSQTFVMELRAECRRGAISAYKAHLEADHQEVTDGR